MDYVADGLIDGRKLRVLAIVDDYSRECLALEGLHGRAPSFPHPPLWGWCRISESNRMTYRLRGGCSTPKLIRPYHPFLATGLK